MKPIDPDFLRRSRQSFLMNPPLSLQQIRDRVAAGVPGSARRDILSALDTLQRVFGRELAGVRADAKTVRELLASRTAAELRLSEKRYANIRSGVTTALRAFGETLPPITRRIPPTPDWQNLLDRIEPRTYRVALYRLACFCSVMAIPPEQVSPALLRGLHQALEAEEAVKNPRRLLKHTIAIWNICRRRVPGWPDVRLSSPFERDVVALPLAAFPESFRQDLERWHRHVTAPDPFDAGALARPLRAPTVAGQYGILVRFASALVHRGVLVPDQVTSLDVLVDVESFKSGLRFFLERLDGRPTGYLCRMASTLRFVAIHHCKVDEARRMELTRICRRLDPHAPRQMAPRNRVRLRQFDDPDNVARLLAFPEAERRRGLAQKNLLRAAKCFERALAVALLIHCSLRIQNLRTIDMTTDLSRAGGKWYLSIAGERVKNGQDLEFELPDHVAALLQEYRSHHRPRLEGADGPFLFPGRDGGPRPHNTMRTDICDRLRKQAGLVMTPHLFRHTIAKIVVERDPSLCLAMSRQLGHKRIDMTMAHYLGTETRAAGRQINRLLRDALADPVIGEV